MNVIALKTQKIVPGRISLYEILNKYLKTFEENSVLAITSKIISICEGRVVKTNGIDKEELVEKEADLVLEGYNSKYGIVLTIKNGLLVPTAGIDESNGNGYYILWPQNSQETANDVRKYLCKRFRIKKAGVIITDSKTTPLRWGTSGVAIAHSGFLALKDYIGKPDIFGRKLKVTKANMMDALAASAVLVMGEGDEQTPLAVIMDIPFVKFKDRNPAKKELEDLKISISDDLYAPLLKSVKWKKGKGGEKVLSVKTI